jgi:peroxiredoxin
MAQLNIGDKAPDFELPVTLEEMWKLSDHIGEQNIVLRVVPCACSPPCHDELCSVRDGFSEWQALDAEIVGISVDHPFVLEKWKEQLGLQYTLVSDFNKTVAPAYGAFHETLGPLNGVAKRSAFIIDREGKIAYASISDDPLVMPDFTAIQAKLEELK